MTSSQTTYPKFSMGAELTQEQIQFFNENGFIHFKKFIDEDKVKQSLDGLMELQARWIAEGRKMVNGVPLKFGFDEHNNKIIHRFAFTSMYSEAFKELVSDPRMKSFNQLLGMTGARLGVNEKDGVVVNQYINTGQSKMKQMGWHTDSLRDIFFGQKVMPMLNVGLNLTDSKKEQGGLRIIPGTHKQSLYSMLFKKPYFVNNEPDKNEVAVETDAGDLTIHHGHMWHRVETAPTTGLRSRRITMYVPIICGRYMPRDEHSVTPFYHRLNALAKK